jgi:hypothetical protein
LLVVCHFFVDIGTFIVFRAIEVPVISGSVTSILVLSDGGRLPPRPVPLLYCSPECIIGTFSLLLVASALALRETTAKQRQQGLVDVLALC